MYRAVHVVFGAVLLIAGTFLLYADGIWLDETGASGSDPVRLSLWLWPLAGLAIIVIGFLRPRTSRSPEPMGAAHASSLRPGTFDEIGQAGSSAIRSDDWG